MVGVRSECSFGSSTRLHTLDPYMALAEPLKSMSCGEGSSRPLRHLDSLTLPLSNESALELGHGTHD